MLSDTLDELKSYATTQLAGNPAIESAEQWERQWIHGSFSQPRLRENVWNAWRCIPAPDRFVLLNMNILLLQRPHETMQSGVYGFADFDQGILTGQPRLVIALSEGLTDWSDGAIKYAAAHEFAHQYLRHPVFINRYKRNEGDSMKSYFEQQAIEWCEYVWPFGAEKLEAMKFIRGKWTV